MSGRDATPPSQESGVPALPNWRGGFSYIYAYISLHPLTQNDQIRHGNTYGFLGQPRHCVCTNASGGLSAIAEFLVFLIIILGRPQLISHIDRHHLAIAIALQLDSNH